MSLSSFKRKIPLFIIVIIILGLAAYYFFIFQKNQTSSNNSTQTAAIETQNLLERVGKLMELPVGEQPQIATVSDASKLPGDQFFAKAVNGDKVLVYNLFRKAILYRPSTNKIIDIAPLAQPTTEPQIQAQATVSATVTPTVVKKLITPILTPTPTITP